MSSFGDDLDAETLAHACGDETGGVDVVSGHQAACQLPKVHFIFMLLGPPRKLVFTHVVG